MAKQTHKITSAQLDLFADPAGVPKAEPDHSCRIVPAEEVPTAVRDSICEEWRRCIWAEACMTPANDETGICYKDEPDQLPLTAFSRDELKVFRAGFFLVKYYREEKELRIADTTLDNGWTMLNAFPTYASAERRLKEYKEAGYVESSREGKIVMTGWHFHQELKTAGFEFYRAYGLRDNSYQGEPCCIKAGSKNWSNLAKYPDKAAIRQAWFELMQDPKALEG